MKSHTAFAVRVDLLVGLQAKQLILAVFLFTLHVFYVTLTT